MVEAMGRVVRGELSIKSMGSSEEEDCPHFYKATCFSLGGAEVKHLQLTKL